MSSIAPPPGSQHLHDGPGGDPTSPLSTEQEQAWFAWMRVNLRLTYEINRQLQSDSDLSLPDYHVLNALADSPGHRLQTSNLAVRIAWERSRVSHHLRRMGARGLVELTPSSDDGRATDAVLTAAGATALLAATPGHARLVRSLAFDGLDPDLLAPLHTALEQIHDQLLARGSLPNPGPPQQRLAGGDPTD